MNARYAPFVAALTLVTGMAHLASAQEATVDVSQLQAITKPGDTLFVTDFTGRLSKWKVGDVPVERFLRQADVWQSDVKEIAIERGDSPWNGALIGLAVAGTPWLIVCATNDWCYYNEYGAENLLRTTAITTAAIGAGIGALVDLSIRKTILIYQATGKRSLKIDVSPGLSESGAMMRLSVRFGTVR